MSAKRRACGKIDRLPDPLKDAVGRMLLSGVCYREIVEFLRDNSVALSHMAVQRYAQRYLATMEDLKLAQENMHMMLEEMDKYPKLDATEAILRVASNKVFNALTSVTDEQWESVPVEKILKEGSALIRAAGYKRRIDLQNQTELETTLDANQSLLFDALAKKHPELYEQVMDAIRAEKEAAEQLEATI